MKCPWRSERQANCLVGSKCDKDFQHESKDPKRHKTRKIELAEYMKASQLLSQLGGHDSITFSEMSGAYLRHLPAARQAGTALQQEPDPP